MLIKVIKTNMSQIALVAGFTIISLVFQSTAFGDSKTATLDVPFSLGIGESANIDSLDFTFLNVTEDSRCPTDVTCIWEGAVSVKVNLVKNGQDLGNHSVSSKMIKDDTQTFEGYHVKLISIEPYPLSSIPIKPTEYVGTFLVSNVNKAQIESPLKQFKTGIPIKDIQCRNDLVLVIKLGNSSPVCVKPETSDKLLERGWADLVENSISIKPIIKTGTYSGHCIGYCAKEFIITSEKIVISETGREFVSDAWKDLPEKTKETSISQKEWNRLIKLVDFQKFKALPDRIGCPGCADAPVEWIEISYGDITKKIEFENGDLIPEIDNLIQALQEMRNTTDSLIDNFEKCASAGNPIMESYPRQCRTSDGKNFVEEINSRLMSPESQCQKYGGNWLPEFNECEAISEKQCSIINGTFNECESACRHKPESIACTLQCVQVCIVPQDTQNNPNE